MKQQQVSGIIDSSIQSLRSSPRTTGRSATSVVLTDGASESGGLPLECGLELHRILCVGGERHSKHARKITHVIPNKDDHGNICGEIPRKDVPSSPAGDRILC